MVQNRIHEILEDSMSEEEEYFVSKEEEVPQGDIVLDENDPRWVYMGPGLFNI